MAKRKLQKFAEVSTFNNVLQPIKEQYLREGFDLKGKWVSQFFENTNPLVLELGCGKGEYTIALAKKYSDKNFIGIDIKGERLWRGSKTALEENIINVGFLRIRIEMIEHFFAAEEVSEIWITFPDPQPNKPRTKKRLTSPEFLEKYSKFLKPAGILHLKTDCAPFFDYSIETINAGGHKLQINTHDLYHSDIKGDVLETQTHYEKSFLKKGIPICYMSFLLKQKG